MWTVLPSVPVHSEILQYFGTRFASFLVVLQDIMVTLWCPDRLFWSIQDTWKSVTTFPTDVKELIPEFYSTDPSFLTVSATADFGQRSSGMWSASNYLVRATELADV